MMSIWRIILFCTIVSTVNGYLKCYVCDDVKHGEPCISLNNAEHLIEDCKIVGGICTVLFAESAQKGKKYKIDNHAEAISNPERERPPGYFVLLARTCRLPIEDEIHHIEQGYYDNPAMGRRKYCNTDKCNNEKFTCDGEICQFVKDNSNGKVGGQNTSGAEKIQISYYNSLFSIVLMLIISCTIAKLINY